VASGLPTDAFLYLGYLPRKSSERQQMLREVAELPYTLIFLETPHRLQAALDDLLAMLGDRQIAVARELTKVHEEIWRGTLSGALEYFKLREPRGEFSLVITGKPPEISRWEITRVMDALETELARGASPSQAASRVASQSGWQRRELYKLLTDNNS
jgi:16S rRNA (cytidine1402-2'-O)-methyltransferase